MYTYESITHVASVLSCRHAFNSNRAVQ